MGISNEATLPLDTALGHINGKQSEMLVNTQDIPVADWWHKVQVDFRGTSRSASIFATNIINTWLLTSSAGQRFTKTPNSQYMQYSIWLVQKFSHDKLNFFWHLRKFYVESRPWNEKKTKKCSSSNFDALIQNHT